MSKAKKSRPKWVRVVKRTAITIGTLVLVGAASLFGVLIWAYYDTEAEVSSLDQKLSDVLGNASVIVSSDGKELYRVSNQNQRVVPLDKIPKFVRNALLAAEDKRFYDRQTGGVDPQGLARAVFLAAREGRASQGGSTLEMQLAKRFYNGSERTFTRKVRDIAVASHISQQKTKDQILEMYLNYVYFGKGAYGIQQASQTYFGKDVQDLSLGEAAILARCVRRPTYDNPFENLDRAIQNRKIVLGVMLEQSWISQKQYDEAESERVHLNPNPPKTNAKYLAANFFVEQVKKELSEQGIDLANGGYRVETTLDSRLERYAEQIVAENVRANRANNVDNAGFVLIDSRGRILADVGGVSWNRSQWDVVTRAARQPGSSFKPIVYAAAMAEGKLANENATVSNAFIKKRDPSLKSGWWTPQNDSLKENRPSYTVIQALASSINRPAIHTLEEVGVDTVIHYAHDTFGIQSNLEPNESIALGSSGVHMIEMAEAYSVFMLRGDRVKPFHIARIIGPDGSVIKEYSPVVVKGVLDPHVCDSIDKCLRAVVEHGTGTGAISVSNAHGKTGTTNSHKDAWFCGYSDGLLGVAWTGNDKHRPMSRSIWGGTVSVGMWTKIMTKAHELIAPAPAPADAVTVAVDSKKNSNPDPVDANGDVPPIQNDSSANASSQPAGTDPSQPQLQPQPSGDGQQPQDTSDPKSPEPRTPDQPTEATPKAIVDVPPGPPRIRRKPALPDEQYVDVNICQDTGLRANMYCPETVVRRFRKGHEPKAYCKIHHAD